MKAEEVRRVSTEANRWSSYLRSKIQELIVMDPLYHGMCGVDRSQVISGEFFWVTDPMLTFLDGDPRKPAIGFCITFDDDSVSIYEDLPPELSARMYRSIVSGWRKHMEKFDRAEKERLLRIQKKAEEDKAGGGK